MIGFAAVAFAACSNHDFETYTQEQIIQEEYKANFVKQFGQPASNQTWGFGSTRAFTRANTTYNYAATSDGINANANEWADVKNSTGFGGWIVPDPLTPEQKALVARYFQSVTDLDYKDPEWSDFFVQQVYKGGNTEKYSTTEGIIAADDTPFTSSNMDLLTVGSAPEHHINNFNGGTYGTEDGASSVNVLQNGSDILAGITSYKPDQIMLMVNIEDTHCMGYHCSATGVTAQRNDKAALVSWQTIAQWQKDNGDIDDINNSILNDTWNRSFVGFDLALKPFDECIVKDNDGNVQYAMINQIPSYENYQYIYDGNKVLKLGTPAPAVEGEVVDITTTFAQNPANNNTECAYDEDGNIVCTFNNQYYNNLTFVQSGDWSQYDKLVIEFAEPSPVALTISCDGEAAIAAGATSVEVPVVNYAYNGGGGPSIYGGTGSESPVTLKIKSVKLVKNAKPAEDPADFYQSEYILVNGDQKIPFLDRNTNQYAGQSFTVDPTNEWISTIGDKECIDLTKIALLVADKKYPTSSALRDWSTWEDGDGYYSDWIVTLHKAERVTTTSVDYQGRIMVEDLSAQADVTGKNSDWDFNDVVFDWAIIGGKAYIRLLAAGGTLPIRIGGTRNDTSSEPEGSVEIHNSVNGLGGYMKNCGVGDKVPYKEFVLEDHTYTTAKEILITVYKGGSWVEIQAEQGQPAAKFNCKVGTKWCDEYVNITRVYPNFTTWVANPSVDWTQGDGSTSRLTDGNLNNNAAE